MASLLPMGVTACLGQEQKTKNAGFSFGSSSQSGDKYEDHGRKSGTGSSGSWGGSYGKTGIVFGWGTKAHGAT